MSAQDGTRILFSMLDLNVDRLRWVNRRGITLLMNFAPYAFFDESGKWQDRDFICLCGYLSDAEKWERFDQRWGKLCGENEITSLHMASLYRQAREKGWDEIRRLDVLLRFAEVIRDNILVGFAVGLDAKHYRSMPRKLRGIVGDPPTACLRRVLRLIRNRLRAEGFNGRLSITLDEEEGAVIGFYNSIARLRKADPELGKYIGAVCFADDTYILPLQAADMLANLTARWFRDRSEGKATADNMPEPLNSLVRWPNTNYGLDYEQELWDAEILDRELTKFLGNNESNSVTHSKHTSGRATQK
jgi:hypothetical protein